MLRWIGNIFAAIVAASLICWILFALALGASPLALLEVPLGFLMMGGVLTIVIWSLGLTRLSTARVRQRSMIVLSYLEQAVRLNLPLSRMLSAAEASEPQWIASRIERLRMQIDSGSSIADALRQAVPGTTRRALGLVGAAERMGRIGPELSRLVRDEQHQRNRNLGEQSFIRSYPVAMTIVIFFILFLVMVFVMPKFQQIFHDFRVPLPPLTLAVIQFTNLQDDTGWLALGIAVALLAAVAQYLRRKFDWLGPARWFTSNRDLADICHVIAEEMEAGLPLDAAIRGASELAIGKPMRRKLAAWADGIERGMTTKDAALNADIPALIAGLATTAAGFGFLSRYYAGKFSRLMILMRAAVIPAMVFFFGIIVAIVALSLFLPLVSLIDCSGPYGGRL